MSKKFEYQEFSTESIVETLKRTHYQDQTIQKAVVAHLSDVISKNEISPEKEHQKPKLDEFHNQGIYSDSEIKKLLDDAFQKGKASGILEAKSEYDISAEKIESEKNIINSLINKLSQITPPEEADNEYVKFTYEVLTIISEKILCNFPTNFEKVVTNLLSKLLQDSYKGGKVVITLNENIKSKIEHFLNKNEKFNNIDNIELLSSSNIDENDCIVEYKNTKLVFDKALVKSEIDDIMNQFKTY